ncbi:hypothetical protein HDU96_006934 [Phlyctochytrium bullatum]|nr:hypothetical protein HDU96_006934 [Phlyctochytrium bullatum]
MPSSENLRPNNADLWILSVQHFQDKENYVQIEYQLKDGKGDQRNVKNVYVKPGHLFCLSKNSREMKLEVSLLPSYVREKLCAEVRKESEGFSESQISLGGNNVVVGVYRALGEDPSEGQLAQWLDMESRDDSYEQVDCRNFSEVSWEFKVKDFENLYYVIQYRSTGVIQNSVQVKSAATVDGTNRTIPDGTGLLHQNQRLSRSKDLHFTYEIDADVPPEMLGTLQEAAVSQATISVEPDEPLHPDKDVITVWEKDTTKHSNGVSQAKDHNSSYDQSSQAEMNASASENHDEDHDGHAIRSNTNVAGSVSFGLFSSGSFNTSTSTSKAGSTSKIRGHAHSQQGQSQRSSTSAKETNQATLQQNFQGESSKELVRGKMHETRGLVANVGNIASSTRQIGYNVHGNYTVHTIVKKLDTLRSWRVQESETTIKSVSNGKYLSCSRLTMEDGDPTTHGDLQWVLKPVSANVFILKPALSEFYLDGSGNGPRLTTSTDGDGNIDRKYCWRVSHLGLDKYSIQNTSSQKYLVGPTPKKRDPRLSKEDELRPLEGEIPVTKIFLQWRLEPIE